MIERTHFCQYGASEPPPQVGFAAFQRFYFQLNTLVVQIKAFVQVTNGTLNLAQDIADRPGNEAILLDIVTNTLVLLGQVRKLHTRSHL